MDDYYYDEYDDADDYNSLYDETAYRPITFFEILLNCIAPSVKNAGETIVTFLALNFVLRTVARLSVPDYVNHLTSIVTGLFLLFYSLDSGTFYFFGLVIVTYLLLVGLISVKVQRLGLIFAVGCMTLLMFCELIENDAKLWHQIRGIQMIAVMKTMSLAFDLEAGKIGSHKDDDVLVNHTVACPNILKYFGYMLCPANCILGPWCSYQDYLEVFSKQLFTAKYFGKIAANSLVSAVFLVLSNCVISFLISDNSWKWLLAYRDALSFRCSHYFVSFLSQATMVTAGFTDKQQTSALNRDQPGWFGYDVVRPQLVEFPRSLVQVVIGWNIPMHYWLKHYIFRVLKPHGIFLAISTTYLMSSLLHGLNLQLAAVLLSLGLYTYIEYKLRAKFGSIFNACILANKCRATCQHLCKTDNWKVVATNVGFSLLTVFHLAYLGVMFEASFTLQESGFSLKHALAKWKELDYASHLTIAFYYVFYYLI